MVEIDLTTVAAAAGSLLAMDPVKKLLGPTADFLGAELQAYTKRRFQNAEKIIEIAAAHIDEKSNDDTVSPRVLLDAVEEGSKVESEIAQKYFGGVLASSRSKNGEDDSAIIFTSMLSEMSSSQIKIHCVLYTALRERWKGTSKYLGGVSDRDQVTTVIDFSAIVGAFDASLLGDLETTMFGLFRLGLIDVFQYGGVMVKGTGLAPYLQFKPTVLGSSLFLAAGGHSAKSSSDILNPDIPLKSIVSVSRDVIFAPSEITVVDPNAFKPA